MHLKELAYLAEVTRMGFRPRGSGFMVARLEEAFARYVNARHAIALCNGTATLHAALAALPPRAEVETTPLTMSATAAAILAAGATPLFRDVSNDHWCVRLANGGVSVSLFGLEANGYPVDVSDAAQSLQKHSCAGVAGFTSYSFQSSKIISAGEGGMLVTNDDELAARARSFASLGYDLSGSSRIDRLAIRDPEAVRHVRYGVNYRMNDITAAVVLAQLEFADELLAERARCADLYRQAHQGCGWLTPQHVPEGASHSWWCYPLLVSEHAFAFGPLVDWNHMATWLTNLGAEKPYAAWALTYDEPAFKHLKPEGGCPVAESIQPRLMLFSTNDLEAAEKNAEALRKAIREIGG